MRQLLALVRLELKLFFRDRRALMLLFVVPIGIASFMGALTSNLGGAGSGRGGIPLIVVDLDGSVVARGVVANFKADANFRVTETNEASARALVMAGKRSVAVILPAGFGAQALPGLFDTNRQPVVTLLYDPSRDLERQMVAGLLVPKVLQSVAHNALTVETVRALVREGMTNLNRAGQTNRGERGTARALLERVDEWLTGQTNSGRLGRVGGGVGTTNEFSLPLPFTTLAEPLTRGEAAYNGYAHSFAGMGVQFVLMAMIDLAVTLLRERESGVFRRLRSLPLSRATLLAGKAIAWAIISLISLSGCFAFAMLVFQVRVNGSWWGFVGVLVATSLLASTLGLALAAVGRTPAGTRGFAIALILLLVMIGGAWMPTFVFPRWLQTISLLVPTRWAMDGLDAMTWRGLGFEAAVLPIAITLLFAVLFAGVAWLRFKWEA